LSLTHQTILPITINEKIFQH